MSLRQKTSQPSLPFGEGWLSRRDRPVPPKSKLMFVLKPPTSISLGMHVDAALHAVDQNGRDAYPAQLMHMTLLCMETFDEPPVAPIRKTCRVAAGIRARPLPITLDSSGLFGGRRHLALYCDRGNEQVVQFSHLLRRALTRYNLPSFRLADTTPHITLIYGCGRIETLPLERNYAWIASEFMLVYSRYGETRHEEFGRWRFDPDAPPYSCPPQQLRMKI